jgi:Adenosylmethionine decarboxylase
MAQPTVLPNPVFEGSEKRIEVEFGHASHHEEAAAGLRALSRATLDDLMALAACEIVSKTSNDTFDAYVLSESSLFVHPTTWVLKTCGTTRLLDCLKVRPDNAFVPSACCYS